jgi:YD repeat-containing protein
MNKAWRRSKWSYLPLYILCQVLLHCGSACATIPAKVTTNTGPALYNSPAELCGGITAYWASRTDSCGSVDIVGGCPGWGELSTSRTIKAWFPDSAGHCPSIAYSYGQSWGTSCTANNSTYIGDGQCQCNSGYKESPLGFCYTEFDPPKCNGPCNRTGNPVNPGTGTKYHEEVLFAGVAASPLKYSIIYNGRNVSADRTPAWAGVHGALWTGEYENNVQGLSIDAMNVPRFASIVRPDGRQFGFYRAIGSNDYFPQGDVNEKLTRLVNANNATTGWRYSASSGSVEIYDNAGRLTNQTARTGVSLSFTYSSASTPVNIAPWGGILTGVADSFGRAIALIYDSSGRVIDLADPSGAHTRFAYDGPSGNGTNNNLTSITYPDGATKIFYYNEQVNTGNTQLPNNLTGIVDENNARYATYQYYWWGGVARSVHAGGAVDTNYGYTYMGPSTILDAQGTTRIYTFQNVLGVQLPANISQPCGTPGCSGTVNVVTTYDANGNVSSKTDFNGNKTTYSYDLTTNLETSRVEATGKAQARTISTRWHAAYRLPTLVAEPMRITSYSYDSNGNLLEKSEQATNDASGAQAFNATVVGTVRTWGYTYNSAGQMLTAADPLNNVTSYSYDTQGNMMSVTNAAGQMTTLANYDANGRVGRITDPNGLHTDLSYSPRGWLRSTSVTGAGGAETTSYDYDGVGQRIRVTLPDGSFIGYTFDDAHRLTDIVDSAGNTIHYTLDKMGNQLTEQVKDPTGSLSRKTTRVYDALNRLQQITGGEQ